MAVVTPTDRPKSVRNCCVIEVFVAFFCWCRGFCHRIQSDLLLFLSLDSYVVFKIHNRTPLWMLHYLRFSFSCSAIKLQVQGYTEINDLVHYMVRLLWFSLVIVGFFILVYIYLHKIIQIYYAWLLIKGQIINMWQLDVNVQVDAIYSVQSIYHTENNVKPITIIIISPNWSSAIAIVFFSHELDTSL